MKIYLRRVLWSALLTIPALTSLASSVLPLPADDDVDVWVLAGQSNMQGSGLVAGALSVDPKVVVFGLNNQWQPAEPPTHRIYTAAAPVFKELIFAKNPKLTEDGWTKLQEGERNATRRTVGPDLAFADLLARTTGRRIALVPCALGATSMAEWSPAKRDEGARSLYGNMLQRIRRVGGKLKGVLWYQGETDACDAGATKAYAAALLNLVDSLRRDTSVDDLPFLFVQISRYCVQDERFAPTWEMLRDAQRRVSAERRNLWMVPAIDLPLDDLIHIAASGQERLGHRLAEVALTHVYGLDGHGSPIDFESCEILPPLDDLRHRLRVRFKGVVGGLRSSGAPTGFEIRTQNLGTDAPVVYRAEFDPTDPSAVILWYSKAISGSAALYYGAGLNPYVNVVDNLDMAVPAFGPVEIRP